MLFANFSSVSLLLAFRFRLMAIVQFLSGEVKGKKGEECGCVVFGLYFFLVCPVFQLLTLLRFKFQILKVIVTIQLVRQEEV